MTDPRLDRRVQFDERSRAFPIRALIPATVKPRSYTWGCTVQLDQGTEGACVGFSICHEAAARPVIVPNVNDDLARTVYHRARQLDPWEGEAYEGTSVLAGIKAGRELGWWSSFRWSFSLNEQILAVGYRGPAVLGLAWYEGMLNTDSAGFVHPTGGVVGAHAILCNSVNVRLKYFTLRNSWGAGWGQNGNCKVSFDDMDRLLHEQGECCIPEGRAKSVSARAFASNAP